MGDRGSQTRDLAKILASICCGTDDLLICLKSTPLDDMTIARLPPKQKRLHDAAHEAAEVIVARREATREFFEYLVEYAPKWRQELVDVARAFDLDIRRSSIETIARLPPPPPRPTTSPRPTTLPRPSPLPNALPLGSSQSSSTIGVAQPSLAASKPLLDAEAASPSSTSILPRTDRALQDKPDELAVSAGLAQICAESRVAQDDGVGAPRELPTTRTEGRTPSDPQCDASGSPPVGGSRASVEPALVQSMDARHPRFPLKTVTGMVMASDATGLLDIRNSGATRMGAATSSGADVRETQPSAPLRREVVSRKARPAKVGAVIVVVFFLVFWLAVFVVIWRVVPPVGKGDEDKHITSPSASASAPNRGIVIHGHPGSSFTIQEFEVSVAEYEQCVDEGFCKPRGSSPSCTSYPRDKHHPANCVTYRQAMIYCSFKGGVLPNDREWALAAEDIQGWKLGCWGREHPCERDVATEDVSKHGVKDMFANLMEWTMPERGLVLPKSLKRYTQGGNWKDANLTHLLVDARKGEQSESLPTVGFRCILRPNSE